MYREIFHGVTIDNIRFGGGTPSSLSEEELEDFLHYVFSSFDMSEIRQFFFEAAPYSMNEEKMKILCKYEMTKITYGIQSFDEEVLKKNNRPQVYDTVKKVVDLAKKYDVVINLDLMAGIPWQSVNNFRETLDLAEEFEVTSIEVNGFIPLESTNYVKSGKIFWEDDIKLRQEMLQLGNSHWEDISRLKEQDKTLQVYGIMEDNMSLLWIWYSACSHAFWEILYYTKTIQEYKDFIDNNDALIHGINISMEEEIVSYLIYNIEEWIHLDTFEEKFWKYLPKYPYISETIDKYLSKKIFVYYTDWKGAKILQSNKKSTLFSSYVMKKFYKKELLQEFYEYFYKNKKEFLCNDLKIKQFFYN